MFWHTFGGATNVEKWLFRKQKMENRGFATKWQTKWNMEQELVGMEIYKTMGGSGRRNSDIIKCGDRGYRKKEAAEEE